MKNRISSGVLVMRGDKVLMVRHVKPDAFDFWVAPGGGAMEEYIVEAAFLSRAELYGKDPFPAILRDVFWDDWAKGFPEPRYLGLRKMQFW